MMGKGKYENFIEKYRYEGQVTILECNICGHLQWGCSKISGQGYNVEPLYDCNKCAEVVCRSPEITQWVLNVIKQAFRKNKKEDEEKAT